MDKVLKIDMKHMDLAGARKAQSRSGRLERVAVWYPSRKGRLDC